MNTLLCVRQNCGSGPHATRFHRTAAPGLRLCTTCFHELKANLVELPEIYGDCESARPPQRNPTLQRVSGSRQTTGILLDEAAIATRSSILGFLASWSALVADERAVTKPTRRYPADLASFLISHLSWLLAHSAAADFAEEISQLTTRACRTAYTQPALRIDLGQCIHLDCNAAMTTTPPTRDGKRTREVRCTAGHTWQPHQWLQLFHQIERTKSTRSSTKPQRNEGAT
ncbi:hypothetical protein [Actinomadura sp. HBU206391]|uniref:hypothetical protein n=1 Tax=Actinomadura sp. HBU206391 TaxID=2731692 RepID=UPI001650B346|nr:hypothetical protein [Actinomadura sp. HBU206391]MBC6456934.1 hypothetical protein [Actinomadura sp. HBU206391]